MIKKIVILIIIFILLSLIYNSKTEYYEKSIEFSNKSFSGEITKIITTRGTKVYYQDYDAENYFYLEDYRGIKLFVGDVFRKSGNEIIIMREDHSGKFVKVGTGKSLKPKESYFSYFTGIN